MVGVEVREEDFVHGSHAELIDAFGDAASAIEQERLASHLHKRA